ncbi:MAG: hypothetical protein HY892_00625 [Deltaproteobacteria bacterium]|nr:hypothetical protein [Deltaproteobacteria bacterium]
MRMVNKGLGGSSSALFFALGGILGAGLAIFAGSGEGRPTSSGLKKMAGAEEVNYNQPSNTWKGKGKAIEKQKIEGFPAQLKRGRNQAGGVIGPSMTEEDYLGFGVLLD